METPPVEQGDEGTLVSLLVKSNKQLDALKRAPCHVCAVLRLRLLKREREIKVRHEGDCFRLHPSGQDARLKAFRAGQSMRQGPKRSAPHSILLQHNPHVVPALLRSALSRWCPGIEEGGGGAAKSRGCCGALDRQPQVCRCRGQCRPPPFPYDRAPTGHNYVTRYARLANIASMFLPRKHRILILLHAALRVFVRVRDRAWSPGETLGLGCYDPNSGLAPRGRGRGAARA